MTAKRSRAKASKLLFNGSEWSFPLIKRAYDAIEEIAIDELKLDCYPNQIEIISSDQMLDAYASIGLPMMYNHWSFGKHFIQQENQYRKGMSGLAYEIIINSNPCIAYLMEENSMTMQALVISHAAFGHCHFFKNNYLFKQWTDAEGILDYLAFAKKYIAKCEEQHGRAAVEQVLDSCHALRNHAVDRYRRPGKLSQEVIEAQKREHDEELRKQDNDLWRTLPPKVVPNKKEVVERFPTEPQENLLYFIEKHSPILQPWQREVVRIVRKLAQYFYPQRMTQVCNEGTACFVHYYIMNRLWEKGQISDGAYLEFIASHTGVVFQPGFDDRRFSGINPYNLGFSMFMDIKRICEAPTAEDKEWFPDFAGTPWLDTFHYAVENFRDESFIQQFLSPALMREKRFFMAEDIATDEYLTIDSIHNARGYKTIRQALAQQYSLSRREPDIQVVDANLLGNRTLKLRHTMYDGIKLDDRTHVVLSHVAHLWGYKVEIETVDSAVHEQAQTLTTED